MPYLRITRLTRFFPVASSTASLRCPIVSSCSCRGGIAHRQLLIHLGTLWLYIETTASDAQCTGKLAFIDRTVGSTDLAGQFHRSRCVLSCPTARGIFLAVRSAP